jgi:type IV pilus assembly protein PilY1
MLQDDAYYQQFQPTPDKSYQLWVGNLKKYLVTAGGVLKGKDGNKIVDSDGKILDNYDYWAAGIVNAQKDADENTVGSTRFALQGGAWSRLLLRTDPVSNPSTGTVQRKVLTNREYKSGSAANSVFGEMKSGILRQVKPTDLTDTNYKNDPKRGYLVRMLG